MTQDEIDIIKYGDDAEESEMTTFKLPEPVVTIRGGFVDWSDQTVHHGLPDGTKLHPESVVIAAYEAGKAEPDFRQMREMLRAMQAGELTVSRGIEILETWWAGNWNDDMLPPVRQDLIEEDSMPVEIIDRQAEQLDAAQAELESLRKDAVPDGWVLVPIEPTREMESSGRDASDAAYYVKQIYKAMIAAAPKEKKE
jgi:hypothetical protein